MWSCVNIKFHSENLFMHLRVFNELALSRVMAMVNENETEFIIGVTLKNIKDNKSLFVILLMFWKHFNSTSEKDKYIIILLNMCPINLINFI